MYFEKVENKRGSSPGWNQQSFALQAIGTCGTTALSFWRFSDNCFSIISNCIIMV